MSQHSRLWITLEKAPSRSQNSSVSHLFSWRAILSAPYSVSFLTKPLSTCSRSAEAADPPLWDFRRDRPLAAPAMPAHARSCTAAMRERDDISHSEPQLMRRSEA